MSRFGYGAEQRLALAQRILRPFGLGHVSGDGQLRHCALLVDGNGMGGHPAAATLESDDFEFHLN